jgi:hypothetical protein
MENAVAQTDQAPQPAKVPVAVGGKIAAFVPTSLEETWRLSTIIASSQMAPKSYNNDPNRIMVGIMAGLELGLSPFTALQSIAVIGNNPSVWGDGALALVEASGLLEYHHETFDDRANVATCTVKRLGKPSETVRTFSYDDAKKASLLGKQGPWQGYPKRMCQMRARAFALRDTFADVLKGIGIAEEVRDHTLIGETRVYAGNTPLSAAMLNQQANAGEPEPATVDAEYVTVSDQAAADEAEPEPKSQIPAWVETEALLRDRIHLAVDRPGLEAIERDFLKEAPNFPKAERERLQKEIDAKFQEIVEAD